jgi:N6-L-threonylcarbamoyladenine synthase
MLILGIETSCDETSAAIVKNGKTILSGIVASSAEMHAKTGGIIPEEAARQQVISIIPVLKETFAKAGMSEKDIDLIAVTAGPGLIGSLLVGVETAKTLSFVWDKPIVSVNHLVAHLYANWLEKEPLEFPALGLVVSGGHTDLVLMQDHGKIKWLGGTRDDAAGEAFDKTARLLSLPYPGGPAISKLAENFVQKNKRRLDLFPRPMIDTENFEWSFSGLKTAVLNEVKSKKKLNQEAIAAEVQEAIVDVLVEKSMRAIKKIAPRSFLLAGGVAANKALRNAFQRKIEKENLDVDFRVPEPKFCTDNATYIASCAFFNKKTVPWEDVAANPNLEITGEA